MAITGLSYAEVNWLVSKHDPDAEPYASVDENRDNGATIFWYGAIPNLIMARISDRMQTSTVEMGEQMRQTFNQKTAERNREAFRWGIREPGFENFTNGRGEPIKPVWENILEAGMSYKVLSEQTMNEIRLSTVQEIGTEIFNRNSLSETQRKNLEVALSRFDDIETGNAPDAANSTDLSEDASETQSLTPDAPKKSGKSTTTGKTRSPAKKGQPAPDA